MKSLKTKSAAIATCLLLVCFACTKQENESKESGEKQESHEPNVISLTKRNLEHVNIKIQEVSIGSVENVIHATGRVSENLNKTARIASTLEGRITKLNFDINDPVKAGDVLALVQAPELIGRQLEVKAPLSGIVTERKNTVGELVDKSSAIYTVSDPSDLWVIAEIKEVDLAVVKIGQSATFNVLAYPGVAFRGKVVRIANQVEAESRTVEARIEIENPDGKLKPGMFADVEIATTAVTDAIVIPDDALQTDEEGQVVFVERGTNEFEKRPVKPGIERHGLVQIVEGLKAGERIVVEGSFILKSEMLKGELGEE